MVNKTDLEYFVELSRTRNVSRAAERLGLTQPTLSYCLKRLEKATDATLFLRTKKGIEITSSGEKLLEQANELIALWDQLITSVREDQNEVSGKVRIGCHSAVAQYTMPAVLPKLLKQNPKLEVELHHGLSRHMTEQVISSKLEIAIVVNPVSHPDLVIKEILRDQITLWRTKTCENPDILMIEPSLGQTQDLLGKLAKKEIHFKRVLTSSSLEVLAQLLTAGTGYALLPERVIRALAHEKFERVPDAPVFHDRIAMIYKKEFSRSARGKAVVKALAAIV